MLHTDPRALVLLRRHVSNCDFALAESAEQACSLLQTALPDAVLVDVASSGWWETVTQRLPEAARLPVLVCPLPNMHHFGVLLGAADYLPKPVLREDLALVLQRLPQPPHVALVVDDDPHIVRLIGRMLRSVAPELRVLECYGGEEGLTLARTHHPDVIFVDLMMPGMSGQRFIELATAEADLARIPIIVVSVRSVEQETAPVQGEVRIQRASGFALGELLALLEAVLMAPHPVGCSGPSQRRSTSSSAGWLTGLTRVSLAPRESASSCSRRTEQTMIGVAAVAGAARSTCRTSQPSCWGIITSSRMSCGATLLQQSQRLMAAVGPDNGQMMAGQIAAKEVNQIFVVVDDQEGWRLGRGQENGGLPVVVGLAEGQLPILGCKEGLRHGKRHALAGATRCTAWASCLGWHKQMVS